MMSFCDMPYCLLLCLYCYVFVIYNHHIGLILYFTQVNKVPVRSLGICLEEDVVVLMGNMLVSPTFSLNLLNYITWLPQQPLKITSVQSQQITSTMQMVAPPVAICIGLSYGLVPVLQVPTTHVRGATL